jgi:DNA-binding transcriptional LysR family regulator
MAPDLLPPLVTRFVMQFPDCALTLGEDFTERLVEALMDHELDVAIVSTPVDHEANRKTREGTPHPDRDDQFRHIAEMGSRFQRRGQPVVSVDTKKKELIGDFKNSGRVWRPRVGIGPER